MGASSYFVCSIRAHARFKSGGFALCLNTMVRRAKAKVIKKRAR